MGSPSVADDRLLSNLNGDLCELYLVLNALSVSPIFFFVLCFLCYSIHRQQHILSSISPVAGFLCFGDIFFP